MRKSRSSPAMSLGGAAHRSSSTGGASVHGRAGSRRRPTEKRQRPARIWDGESPQLREARKKTAILSQQMRVHAALGTGANLCLASPRARSANPRRRVSAVLLTQHPPPPHADKAAGLGSDDAKALARKRQEADEAAIFAAQEIDMDVVNEWRHR